MIPSETKHSLLPWKVDGVRVLGPHGTVARTYYNDPVPQTSETWEARANAALIVNAVNNHMALVETLHDELTALRIWQHAIHPRSDIQEGIAISIDKIERVLMEVRQ